VRYCGDRVKRGQLNGKSANLNHAILTKLYPNIRRASDIPSKDVIMIMDCDHMVKPQIFMKMGACMLDRRVAVTLVPQVPNSASQSCLLQAARKLVMVMHAYAVHAYAQGWHPLSHQ
jgi:cellulose synthase/poly-beta-1,6-N-acetylglucosamine synthase-like glycosyltransferase